MIKKFLHKIGLHNYKMIKRNHKYSYQQCSICKKRRIRENYLCGVYQPKDLNWIRKK